MTPFAERKAAEGDRQIKYSYSRSAHEGFQLFYRVWYCVVISQVNLCGIIVEIIWSYN